MRLHTVLATLILICATIAGRPAPASAMEFVDYDTHCSPALAEFEAYYVDDDHKRVDGKPYKYAVTDHGRHEYPGLFGHIFRCEVAGHVVRMNFVGSGVGTGPCGGIGYGFVSVWFDGVKVVNHRQFDWYEMCRASDDGTEVIPRISRILINNQMHMTICTLTDLIDKKAPVCTLTDLSALVPDMTSLYYAPIILTKPGFVLTQGRPTSCNDATRQLNSGDPLGGILAPIPDVPVERFEHESRIHPYALTTSRVDIDNDGTSDALAFQRSGQYGTTWVITSGKTGKVLDLGGTALAGGWNNQTRLREAFRFVRIRKSVFALIIDYSDYGDPVVMAGAGFTFDGSPPKLQETHQLIEFHNDGTYSVACAWAPRLRPEEFL
jgi:hypothetical protein